ncbi:MAG TPA: hypothetical protein VMG31_06405 [Verrucomicrobiae bacterium]|nr:hypothetical protein [Verrucomicrobiae bacterium]
MKPAKLAFAAIFLLATSSLFAQTLVERLFLMRTETTTFDQYTGMVHTCVLVYPDGRYRMERTFQSVDGSNPDTKVYVDTLPDADLKALQAVLDDSQLQEIRTAPPRGGIVKDMDTLTISIPREHTMQNIAFVNAVDRKPYEKALKPFQNSLKNLEKRKVPVAKAEQSNNCEAPRVIYRSTLAPGASNDENRRP